ncbi:nucleotide exchange factors-like protein [Phellopilus nigrolimitatus]|nr:nucleotide exchange factors-like protein [Phellopilus nigrolimitatus]
MQSLLRWSIENTDRTGGNGGDGSSQQPKQIDPEIINVLMGRPESELMKDALAVATDVEKNEDDRLQALDDFEMLVENIDNAINIGKMDMWPPLQELLTSPSSSDKIRSAVLWIIGTAAQNNPAAQNAYIPLPNSPLSKILERLAPNESSSGTRSKAVYALSGLLKHNARGVKLLEESAGWKVLKTALADPDITVRRKTVFLLSSLLLSSAFTPSSPSASDPSGVRMHGTGIQNNDEPQQPDYPNSHAGMTSESTATAEITSAALQEHGITADLVQGLVNPIPHGKDGDEEGDADLEEKLVRYLYFATFFSLHMLISFRLFYTYLTSARGELEDNDKEVLLSWIQERRGKGENWDLGSEELDTLQRALTSA